MYKEKIKIIKETDCEIKISIIVFRIYSVRGFYNEGVGNRKNDWLKTKNKLTLFTLRNATVLTVNTGHTGLYRKTTLKSQYSFNNSYVCYSR